MARQHRRAFGSIFLRGKIWWVKWIERGQRRRKGISKTKELAERFLAQKAAQVDREEALGIRAVESIKFEDLVEQYESLFAGQKSPNTVLREFSYVKSTMVPFFKGMLIEDVRREDIERFLTKRLAEGIAPATRNRLLSVLSALFKKALRLNHCRENPCAGIPRSKEALREPPFLDVAAQRTLVEAMTPRLRNAVQLSLDTGLRKAELLRISWQDVDFNRKVVTIRVTKNKRPRIVPLTGRGIAALESQKDRRPPGGPRVPDLVFGDIATVGVRGEPYLQGCIENEWKKCRAKAGFPDLHWHDMRHAFAVTAARAGVPLGDIMKILGHSSLVMVLRYSHHAPANSGDLARQRLEKFLEGEGEVREPSPAYPVPAFGNA